MPMLQTIIESLLNDADFKAKVSYVLKKYPAQDVILSQGKAHSAFYVVRSGRVRVIVNAEIKENSPLRPGIAELGPHDVFGEFCLFDDLPASADVSAITDVELIEINISSFKTYLENNPQIGYQIYLEMLKALVKRLRHADKTILNLYLWGMKAHQIDKHLG